MDRNCFERDPQAAALLKTGDKVHILSVEHLPSILL